MQPVCGKHICPPIGTQACCCPTPGLMKLKDLKEQYAKLQDDYKGKCIEAETLRDEHNILREIGIKAKVDKVEAEKLIRESDELIKKFLAGQEGKIGEEIAALKSKIDVELERTKVMENETQEVYKFIVQQADLLQGYKDKYSEAENQVSVQHNQIEKLTEKNNTINSQTESDLLQIKQECKEKLNQLQPMSDELKNVQIDLLEKQRLHLELERENEDFKNEIADCKKEIEQLEAEYKTIYATMAPVIKAREFQYEGLKRRYEELLAEFDENERLKISLDNEIDDHFNTLDQQQAQVIMLREDVDELKLKTSQTLTKTKEQCESVRRVMHYTICQLEREVAYANAVTAIAQRDSRVLKEKMNHQITNLLANFNDSELQTRFLQDNVDLLKLNDVVSSTSTSTDSCICKKSNKK